MVVIFRIHHHSKAPAKCLATFSKMCHDSPQNFQVGQNYGRIIQSIKILLYLCLIHIKLELFNNQNAKNNAPKFSNNFRKANLP